MQEYWYKEAIIYELHVRCFYDSSGDGIGDFQGLTQKLDYLQDLGVTAIWLLPFYPSPLKDDGYDIADYKAIHPLYGNLKDFQQFLQEAHQRGLKVITELVLNHTSDQHLWFQRARKKDSSSYERNFYVWSQTPDKYKEARVVFQDFEPSNWSWDREAQGYFWHRFYSHQPDLNFDHPPVQKELLAVMRFWFKMGVDGVRLDAVPYLYEREGTICENLPETHLFLKKLRAFVDANFSNKMLLAEANQWPEEAALYFGEGDECHMAFHFPVMPRLFMAIHLEETLPIVEIMGQTPEIPDNCQWALFLRNHDELTLEMVTDEERDYMFRIYADDTQARLNLGIRRRLAPLLKNDRRKIELMNVLLFSLHGTPVLYYGDEIGMGDNIYLGDRNGVRTPMQWSSDRNAGFSKANPQRLYLPPIIDPEYHYETVNVEAQVNNPYSLFWWTKHLIALRKRYRAFSYGRTEFVAVDNRKVLVFFRIWGEELLLIIANLSRFAQYVTLDLRKYAGYNLVEMFSGERFPPIGELPYFLTLGGYGYYWFSLEKQPEKSAVEQMEKKWEGQSVALASSVGQLLLPRARRFLEGLIRSYLSKRCWFAPLLSKMDKSQFSLVDQVILSKALKIHLLFVEITLRSGVVDRVPLLVHAVEGRRCEELLEQVPEKVIVRSTTQQELLYEQELDLTLAEWLIKMMREQRRLRSEHAELKGMDFPEAALFETTPLGTILPQEAVRDEEAQFLALKEGGVFLSCRLEGGLERDVEMRMFLMKKTSFRSFAPLKGILTYKVAQQKILPLACYTALLSSDYCLKTWAVEAAERFLLHLAAQGGSRESLLASHRVSLMQLLAQTPGTEAQILLNEQQMVAERIAETAAEFHLAISSHPLDPEFSPVSFTLFYQRSWYQVLRRKAEQAFRRLKERSQSEGKVLEEQQSRFLKMVSPLLSRPLTGQRIRHHGLFILENLYDTGRNILISNFNGIPGPEKRYKLSPLSDVASLLLSLTSTAFEAAAKLISRGVALGQSEEEQNLLASSWALWIMSSFLKTYLSKLPSSPLLATQPQELDFLLALFLIEKLLEKIAQAEETELFRLAWQLFQWISIYGG